MRKKPSEEGAVEGGVPQAGLGSEAERGAGCSLPAFGTRVFYEKPGMRLFIRHPRGSLMRELKLWSLKVSLSPSEAASSLLSLLHGLWSFLEQFLHMVSVLIP